MCGVAEHFIERCPPVGRQYLYQFHKSSPVFGHFNAGDIKTLLELKYEYSPVRGLMMAGNTLIATSTFEIFFPRAFDFM